MSAPEVEAYLEQARELAIEEIRSLIPRDETARRVLYDLVLDYPLRSAKGLRPALCIAACRAQGGQLEAVAPSAAVLELYHNAFLIHDDIEDDSELRRGRPTLHLEHGVPIAVNVGDAMLALALTPLLANTRLLGLGRALRILQSVAHMVTLSAEGQAIELNWIARQRWDLSDDDYRDMVVKKTGWYSFITPLLVGAIAAGASTASMPRLAEFARCLSISFQIQDDVLNVDPAGGNYGKEFAGDLWEGKRTLILLHCLRSASADERSTAVEILSKPRPKIASGQAVSPKFEECIDRLFKDGDLSPRARDMLVVALAGHNKPPVKRDDEVRYLLTLINKYRSIEHARQGAQAWVGRAHDALLDWSGDLEDSQHLRFLYGVLDYVVARTR